MKRILIVMAVSLFAVHTMAQKSPADSTATAKQKKKFNFILGDHANDHLMLQLGYSDFLNKHDSVSLRGFSRSVNAYFMMAFNSVSDPRFSLAVGLGVGTDNYYLNKQRIDITNQQRGTFVTDTANDYKKSKLAMAYLQLPLELRFSSNPDNPNRAWKFALGVKGGLLMSAHTKVKMIRDVNGVPNYTIKYKDNHLFNSATADGTFRVGYGVFSLFTDVEITNFFKANAGPPIRPFTVGVTISGL